MNGKKEVEGQEEQNAGWETGTKGDGMEREVYKSSNGRRQRTGKGGTRRKEGVDYPISHVDISQTFSKI